MIAYVYDIVLSIGYFTDDAITFLLTLSSPLFSTGKKFRNQHPHLQKEL